MPSRDERPRRSAYSMWVIYARLAGEKLFYPLTDVHGHAVAYPTRKSAAPDLYNARNMRGKGRVILQKVGPIR